MAVSRIACVDVPAFPLQLVRRVHPEWRGRAVVVVDRDSPRGLVLWANEQARKVGILPGVRYAAGLSLDADLRATVVPEAMLVEAIGELTELLRRYSPTVEPSPVDAEPGLFWLDAEGLSLLYPSLAVWGEAVRAALGSVQLRCGIAVGYSRFGSYVTARARAGRDLVVWQSLDDEQRAAARVPLHRTGLDPVSRDALTQLGIETVGQLASLPAAGLRRRFGAVVHRLHQQCSGTLDEPLTPALPEERFEKRLDFDDAVADREALGFFVKQLLDPLLARLASRGQALLELTLVFTLERASPRTEMLRPAVATLDLPQLHGLVRLRLESTPFDAGATSIELRVLGQKATREQLTLFFEAKDRLKQRDRPAGDRALARLRASLGDQAVVTARLRAGHLPEAAFSWVPLDKLVDPQPRRVLAPPVVRRMSTRPEVLPPRPRHEPDGWMLRGLANGPVEKLTGPFCVSGGWWNTTEVRRDYYFASLSHGDLCWIYFDHRRRRWYLHGEVA